MSSSIISRGSSQSLRSSTSKNPCSPPVCVYEVLAGEVFRPGGTDIHQRRQDFGRVEALEFSERIAIEAARLQAELLDDGESLAPRDMMIAATARSTGDEFVVADSDFQTDVLADYMTVPNLRK